jgi:ribosomal protein S27AE
MPACKVTTCPAVEAEVMEVYRQFTCPQCGMTSHNKYDIGHSYCGNCHTFVSDHTSSPDCRCHPDEVSPRGTPDGERVFVHREAQRQ